MKVGFQVTEYKPKSKDILAVEAIIFEGEKIGTINVWEKQDEPFQAVLRIATEDENPLTSQVAFYGYGRTREEAIEDALEAELKRTEIAIKKCHALKTKIIGSNTDEQKEEPNTSGRVLS